MTAAAPTAPARPIPLTVVGGFLGAGKTTLVNAVLAQAQARRLAILVNDFGALSIDSALVSSRGQRTVSLANGCVCCTLVNGLAQALLDVLSFDPPPDHVLIEASGVADPRRIAQIARADRAFAQDATVVLAAADQIRTLASDRYVGDTVVRQLVAADLIVLNKVDLVDQGDSDAIAGWLHDVANGARVVRVAHAALPCDVVLGLRGADGTASDRVSPGWRRLRGYPVVDHGSTFATRTFRRDEPLCEAALRDALDALPHGLLRAKGFVRFDSAAERVHLVQAVGRRWSITPAPPGASATPCTLVVVGTAALSSDDDLAQVASVFAH